jgi:hypothetical protein
MIYERKKYDRSGIYTRSLQLLEELEVVATRIVLVEVWNVETLEPGALDRQANLPTYQIPMR